MKKWMLLAFALIIVVVLAVSIKKPSGEPPDTNGQDYFNGKVLEVYENYVEVECLGTPRRVYRLVSGNLTQ